VPQTVMRCRRVGVIWEAERYYESVPIHVEAVFSLTFLPAGVMQTHEWRCIGRTR
jgi:hypothetical protein